MFGNKRPQITQRRSGSRQNPSRPRQRLLGQLNRNCLSPWRRVLMPAVLSQYRLKETSELFSPNRAGRLDQTFRISLIFSVCGATRCLAARQWRGGRLLKIRLPAMPARKCLARPPMAAAFANGEPKHAARDVVLLADGSVSDSKNLNETLSAGRPRAARLSTKWAAVASIDRGR